MLFRDLLPEQAKLRILETEADQTAAGTLEGYASVFGNVDSGGEVVVKGAFAKTLKERLKKGAVKLYDSHLLGQGTDAVIGVVEDAEEDDYGLKFRARFSATTRAQTVRQKIKEGVLNALSFGYDVVKDQWDEAKKVRYLKELRLFEVSVVPWGMNPKALIEAVKEDASGAPEEEDVTPPEETSPTPEDVAGSETEAGPEKELEELRAAVKALTAGVREAQRKQLVLEMTLRSVRL